MKLSVIRGGGRFHALISVAVVAGFAFCAAYAETYTWTGPDNGEWTGANWKNEAGETVVWTDGNDAVFNGNKENKITVGEAVKAGNISVTGGTSPIYFYGTAPLSWTGEIKSAGGHGYIYCPLVDDGNGLHFNFGGHLYLLGANLHTGGTHIGNTAFGALRAFIIDGVYGGASAQNDFALGPVPKTKQPNIFIEGKNVALHVGSVQKDFHVHTNRTIVIRDGQTFNVSPNGVMHIDGDIKGENEGTTAYPTGTRLRSHHQWSGLTVLHGTNMFGRLLVSGRLEIAGGKTTLITKSAGVNENAALCLTNQNEKAYSDKHGYLMVSGGLLGNYQNAHRFQTGGYGHLDVAGGTVEMAYKGGANQNEYGGFLNGYDSPGKVTIRDGGLLRCSKFRLSQTTIGNGGELFLEEGGTLRVRYIGIDFKAARKGIVHFNGGRLQSLEGNSNTSTTESPSNANWAGSEFKVEAGGAIFDTSNGQHLWFGRPLLTGVAEGETDGGLTCRLANGRVVVLHDNTAGSTFNGPTRLVAADTGTITGNNRTLQCRVANALPTTATLQIGPGCRAAFSSYAGGSGSQERENADLEQTIARLEGCGKVIYNSKLTVTGAVAPVFDGVYGTLVLEKPCTLNCYYEITGDANGCSCLELNNIRQELSGLEPPSIAGLKLKLADGTTLNKHAAKTTYKILNAQNGFTGKFDESALPSGWTVKYEDKAAYLCYEHGLMLIVW